jgi:hypothetical protein
MGYGARMSEEKNPAAVALGRLGGLASAKVLTPKKARAARRNGKKGGRPKKQPTKEDSRA